MFDECKNLYKLEETPYYDNIEQVIANEELFHKEVAINQMVTNFVLKFIERINNLSLDFEFLDRFLALLSKLHSIRLRYCWKLLLSCLYLHKPHRLNQRKKQYLQK